MLKAIYAVATAAIIWACIVALPIFSPERQNAKPSVGECRQNAWPYHQAPCMSGPQKPSLSARVVRVIPVNRTN
jgi:hypothetical protein